jgi:phosphohistidine phosphatase
MPLYLVQHGQAQPKEVDPTRPLTALGELETRRVAGLVGRLHLELHQIRHSGKVRALQTAEILATALRPPAGVIAVPGLEPDDDVRPVAAQLGREPHPIMIVGHLPFVARLAAQLVAGDPERPVVQVRHSAVICLVPGAGDRWLVAWIATPEMA